METGVIKNAGKSLYGIKMSEKTYNIVAHIGVGYTVFAITNWFLSRYFGINLLGMFGTGEDAEV